MISPGTRLLNIIHYLSNSHCASALARANFTLRPRRIAPPWTAIPSSLKSFSTRSVVRSVVSPPEEPRSLPVTGFQTLGVEHPIEEEELPDYRADRFYPVRLGEVFQDRYQIVAKLGFGASSTTWLARDLRDRQYVAVKVYVHTSLVQRELPCYHHIARHATKNGHEGRNNIRKLFDSFEVSGPDGKHAVLVFEAAQMSLRDLKLVFRKDGFDEDFVKGAITELLKALDFLHTHGEAVHTDVHPGNMLLGFYDSSLLQRLEEKEFTSPVPRKIVSSPRTIYLSRVMRPKEGPMLLSDFGEARIGRGPHAGDIMPLEYRAPETLLYVGWSYPERQSDFWDEQGNWLGLAPIPSIRTMETLESRLEDKSGFVRFIRRALTWMPEQRATAKELLQDPWLTGESV